MFKCLTTTTSTTPHQSEVTPAKELQEAHRQWACVCDHSKPFHSCICRPWGLEERAKGSEALKGFHGILSLSIGNICYQWVGKYFNILTTGAYLLNLSPNYNPLPRRRGSFFTTRAEGLELNLAPKRTQV